MRVTDVTVVEGKEHCELAAQVESGLYSRPSILWYRFPKKFIKFLSARNGDPFVAALLLPAMRANEPLEIFVPVSPKLLQSLSQIQAIYRCWDPTLSQVRIKAPVDERFSAISHRSSTRGLFFSLGVDSFYSLLKNLKDHPADNETITHLILVHGFDIFVRKGNDKLFPAVLDNATKVAQELGKEVLPVATNLRDFSDGFVDWGPLYHGAALASVGLACEHFFTTIYIAASRTYADIIPWGSHPIVDPLWSTERLSLLHDGCEARRIDKIHFIAQSEVALRTLRVCWENPNDLYNCGRCEKCLRTMIGLHMAGSLQNCRTLPNSVDIDLVRNISIQNQRERKLFEDLANALGSSETDLAIKSALEECLLTGQTSIRERQLQEELRLIYQSRSWQVIQKYWRTMDSPLVGRILRPIRHVLLRLF